MGKRYFKNKLKYFYGEKNNKISNGVKEAVMPYTEESPFEVTFAQFRKMLERERRKLRQRVLEDEGVKALIKRHIVEQGCCWILICGTNDHIVGLAITKEQILPSQKISSFASNKKRAPFEFKASDQDVKELISRLL